MRNWLRSVRRRLGWALWVPAFYWWAHWVMRTVLTVVARWKVTGRERVPREGALIVVANHLNNIDPPVLAAAIARRRVRFMAKIELFKWPFGLFPRLYGAFPVRRFESDVGAMLTAERLLKRGEVLGMFPEGTRSRSGYVGRPHSGTAMIALRSGATLLPCAVAGTEQLGNPFNVFRQPRISVTIGEPIAVAAVRRPSEAEVRELTARVFAAITAMLPAKYLPTYTEVEGTADSGDG
ncbi:MAG: lysophospholipid acyltransferase family protein [Tepidiformaceae bacterium]